MFDDIYGGTPKYSSAQDIYDALEEMSKNEEQGILEQIGVDVSYESQTYYYTDKAYKLKEKFDELSDYLNDMWRFDLAICKLDAGGIYEIIAEALRNDALAKKIGFKKILVDWLLDGDTKRHKQAAEEFGQEIEDINRYDFYGFHQAFTAVADRHNIPYSPIRFNCFVGDIKNKIEKLDMSTEIAFIAECRAHLTSYDDFVHGLRANQALYEMQEQQYNRRMLELTNDYNAKVQLLLDAAGRIGLLPELSGEMQRLGLSIKELQSKPAQPLDYFNS